MRLIDANIFIYSAGTPHPLRDPCIAALRGVADERIAANINVEVLQEVLNYYHRRGDLPYGQDVLNRALALFPSPFSITKETFGSARRVLNDHPQISARDAIHAAVVLEHRLEGIISTDRGFDTITGVTRFDPRDV